MRQVDLMRLCCIHVWQHMTLWPWETWNFALRTLDCTLPCSECTCERNFDWLHVGHGQPCPNLPIADSLEIELINSWLWKIKITSFFLHTNVWVPARTFESDKIKMKSRINVSLLYSCLNSPNKGEISKALQWAELFLLEYLRWKEVYCNQLNFCQDLTFHEIHVSPAIKEQ